MGEIALAAVRLAVDTPPRRGVLLAICTSPRHVARRDLLISPADFGQV